MDNEIPSYYPLSERIPSNIDLADTPYSGDSIEIEGVVSRSGQSGHPTDDYVLHFSTLAQWRYKGGDEIFEKKLLIIRPVEKDKSYFDDLPPLSIVRMQVYLNAESNRAVFEKGWRMNKSDLPELDKRAIELSKPIVKETKLFGTLKFNPSIEWFEGIVDWNGNEIRVSFSIDDNDSIEAGLKSAETIWSDQKKWKKDVDKFAVSKLLSLKNLYWLDDDETAVSEEEFKTRMTLTSISFDEEGGFEFWHDDGDLFFGHSIQIGGSLKEGLTQADIPG